MFEDLSVFFFDKKLRSRSKTLGLTAESSTDCFWLTFKGLLPIWPWLFFLSLTGGRWQSSQAPPFQLNFSPDSPDVKVQVQMSP